MIRDRGVVAACGTSVARVVSNARRDAGGKSTAGVVTDDTVGIESEAFAHRVLPAGVVANARKAKARRRLRAAPGIQQAGVVPDAEIIASARVLARAGVVADTQREDADA